eukprot:scaffold15561_cov179-Amphora_coffeaeformis.AAC.2
MVLDGCVEATATRQINGVVCVLRYLFEDGANNITKRRSSEAESGIPVPTYPSLGCCASPAAPTLMHINRIRR